MRGVKYSCVIVFFGLVGTVLSINCYQCNSHEHPECADISPNDTSSPFLHKCEPRDNYRMFCRKIVQTVLDTPQFTRVTRSCGWLVYKNNESHCKVGDTDFKLETVCQCFTDGCNSSSSVAPAAATLMLVLLVMLR